MICKPGQTPQIERNDNGLYHWIRNQLFKKTLNPCMGFIHLLNRDESNFQNVSRVGVIRNDHLNHEVVWLFSISEFSMFFAKLNLIII